MTDKLREQISALADNELPQGEHELLLRRFAGERSLRLCWERYHLVGEAMRKTLPAVDSRGLADRVMATLSQERAPAVVPAPRRVVLRAVAGVAVAASVAVISVVGLRHDARVDQASVGPAEIVPQSDASQAASGAYGFANSASWDGVAPQVQASLRSYLVSRDDVATALNRTAVPPYQNLAAAYPYLPAPQADKKAKAVKAGQSPRRP